MSWRDQLQPASFRQIPFFVENAPNEIGRRVVVHEYPLQEKAETEDLGARAKRMLVEGYVVGPDYFAPRDRLLEALQVAGPGELVHPYLGTFSAQLISARMTESTREGGLARFEMEFIEAAVVASPLVYTDTPARVRAQAGTATDSSAGQFESAWPSRLGAEYDRALAAVTDALQTINSVVGTATDVADDVAAIVTVPSRITAAIQAAIQRLTTLAQIRRLFAYRAPAGGAGKAAIANAAALTALVQQQAVIAAAAVAAGTSFDSVDSALSVRAELVDAIDIASSSADDDVFAALQDLRARVVEDLRTRAVDLSRIEQFTPAETLPVLVIAQRLYGLPDGITGLLTKAEDIVARNAIEHPGFVPGGRMLEVLSD